MSQIISSMVTCKKMDFETNMHVQLQNYASAERFANQCLDIGNGKVTIDRPTQCITLVTNVCKMTNQKRIYSNAFPKYPAKLQKSSVAQCM